jgi:tRNA (cmo5U34)-methyltransferase
LHHLSAEEKRRLFAELYRRLSTRGALLIADLVEPQRVEARALFAATWDRMTEAQSQAKTGSEQLFDKFVAEQWNYYRFPDPIDRPSPVFEQLTWLKAAGFAVVDCFWLQAGHAIYGGYKSREGSGVPGLSFATALRSARDALRTTL